MVIYKEILTIEQLLDFCKNQKFQHFSSVESGYRLAVKVPTTFEEVNNADNNHRGMMKLKFKIFHTGLNRNGSYVSKESAEKAMNTIADRPVLAAIHQLDDGSWDFEGHEMKIIKRDDGESELEYIESQVGSFSSEPAFWEHDDNLDKDYVCAYAYISEEYTKAAEIIRNKNGTKNSCELFIDELSYNAKENYLELKDFFVNGSTLLGRRDDGTEISEGMLGSRADIADFSVENNSVKFSYDKNLIQIMQELKESLDNYTKAFNAENTTGKEDAALTLIEEVEVVENEKVTTEEVVMETEETIVEEATEIETEETTAEEEVTEVEAETEADTGDSSEEVVEENIENDVVDSVEFTVTRNGESKTFSVSLNDKLSAMYNLINETYGELDNEWYDINMYDEEKTVEMYGYFTGRNYRQTYKTKKDNYTLIGDRVEIYKKYMSQDEINALESLKSNYAELEQYKASKEAAEAHKERMSVLESYSSIEETEEYKALVKNIDSYSVDEVSEKADAIVGKYARQGMQFSFEDKKPLNKKIGIVTKEAKNPKSYSGLFD